MITVFMSLSSVLPVRPGSELVPPWPNWDLRRKELLVLSIARAGRSLFSRRAPRCSWLVTAYGLRKNSNPVVPPGGFGPEEEGS